MNARTAQLINALQAVAYFPLPDPVETLLPSGDQFFCSYVPSTGEVYGVGRSFMESRFDASDDQAERALLQTVECSEELFNEVMNEGHGGVLCHVDDDGYADLTDDHAGWIAYRTKHRGY